MAFYFLSTHEWFALEILEIFPGLSVKKREKLTFIERGVRGQNNGAKGKASALLS